MPKLTRRSFLRALGLGAVGGVGAAVYSRDCADWLSVEHSELRLERWDTDGFKVGLVADLHVNNEHEMERARRAIALAIAEKPDLIVLAGDFANYSKATVLGNITRALDPLHGFSGPTVAVLGNHDYDCARPQELIDTVRHSPLRLLRNEVFEFNGVTIAGLDDASMGRQKYDFFPADRVSKSCLAVLHEPDYVRHMPEHVSLQLSGHTHGGQVCLPFGLPLHTPAGGRKYISGYFADAEVPLFVTRGVGTVGVDYRLFCRPEVTILTLRSA